ncbi:hypothetical protein GWO43_19560 [candidate division KSB1 bacterium]|nr:hypothetical protein [candidate division KSB1 bacterium]NIR71377.1 hypothetical protein [candidate division KSB1 bacterium]NIS26271.1 hypothetical protein [candidate division KSB1 bacterium]NIT73033.1 hypothetical protein [candidate division KSB1 bacterium]NIU26941.1 hypothetical protein [candidate division KSB1 bacterium]
MTGTQKVNDFESLKPHLNQIQTRALVIGLLALALCVVGAIMSPVQFFRSYLFAYLFWIGIVLGSFALVALHHLVGGGWGFAIQRLLESSSWTLPLMVLLIAPLFFGMQELYIWARSDVVAVDAVLQQKEKYLNVPFFWIRTGAYFIIWMLFIAFLNKWSKDQDRTADASITSKLQKISGPAILLYVLTVTFSSIDWVMSLDPHWFSTIFGFVFVIGQALLTLAFAIVVVVMLSDYKPLSDVLARKHFHDLGNLMMAFVLLWAYISVSQFIIIWSGNLPEEIPWYLHRLHGGWQWLALAIVIFHFALPFILLLSRRTKQRKQLLFKVALAMIFMRLVDLFWIVAPNFHPEQISVHWMDVLAPIGIGGIWLAAFIWNLKDKPLLPLNDPRLKEAFQHD